MDSSKTWFAEWFDTNYYHILYQHRNEEEAKQFIAKLISHLKVPKGSRCLDLACGKGRHAKFLSEHGLNVTGLDLSPNSIESAKQFENKNLIFDVHDMRLKYGSHKFDYIFNLFTSFGYFNSNSDNIKVLKAIEDMLLPNGIAVIDFMNAEKVIKKLVSSEQKELNDIQFNITRRYDNQHIFKDIKFTDQGESYHFTERVQALKKSDFIEILKHTNLELVRVYGDYQLNDFEENSSDRLILILQKNE